MLETVGDVKSKQIEFFGLPGSGKTFVSWHFSDFLESKGEDVSRRGIQIASQGWFGRVYFKLLLVIYCIFKNPKALGAAFAIVRKFSFSENKYFIKILFNWYYICGLIVRGSQKKEYLVFDQGISQALWSTAFYSKTIPRQDILFKAISNFIEQLPIRSITVAHVWAVESTVRSRLQGRKGGKSPLDNASKTAWEHAIYVTDNIAEILGKIVQQNVKLKVIDLKNSTNGFDASCLEKLYKAAEDIEYI